MAHRQVPPVGSNRKKFSLQQRNLTTGQRNREVVARSATAQLPGPPVYPRERHL